MAFKLGDYLKAETVQALALPVDRCPATGKTCFPTKDDARKAARKQHGHRTKMIAFRCSVCGFVHLGHRRGSIL